MAASMKIVKRSGRLFIIIIIIIIILQQQQTDIEGMSLYALDNTRHCSKQSTTSDFMT
jgi:hypothetical protein